MGFSKDETLQNAYNQGDAIDLANGSGTFQINRSATPVFNIDNVSNIGIGDNTPAEKLEVVGTIRTSNNVVVKWLSDADYNANRYLVEGVQLNANGYLWSTQNSANYNIYCVHTTGTAYNYVGFYNGATLIGTIKSTNGSTVAYNTTSDRRLKTNIEDMPSVWELLRQIRPVYHNWTTAPDAPKSPGFIADEVQQIFPEAITGEPNAVDEEGQPIYQQINLPLFIPPLVNVAKEAQTRIETLEAKVVELENQILSLQTAIANLNLG